MIFFFLYICLTQAKALNQGCPSARQKELFKLNKNGLRKVIGFLTEDCPLRKHFAIMSIRNNPICRGYCENKEMIVHILYEYKAYSAYRFEHLSQHLLEP